MKELKHQLRWALPMWLVLKATDWLPENRVTLRLRGVLARPFIGQCGKGLQLGVEVTLLNSYNLKLGSNVYIAKGSWLNAMGGLEFGDEVVLGPYVVISTLQHLFKDGSVRFGGSKAEPVRIGKGTWLASHTTVKCGVTVGSGCIVASNASVTTNVADNTIVGGVPAEVIGSNRDSEAELFSRQDYLDQ